MIFGNPESRTVVVGDRFALSVSYRPQEGALCQWYKDGLPLGDPIAGGVVFLDANDPEDGGTFYAVVTNAAGSATSQSAEIVVTLPDPPRILRQPQGGSGYEGGVVLINSTVAGRDVTVRWFKNGVFHSESDGDNLQLGPLTKEDEGTYYFIASNRGGAVTSDSFTITVLEYVPPTITLLPHSTAAPLGGEATFMTAVDNETQPQETFWRHNGTRIPNSGNPPSLSLNPIRAEDDGSYTFHAANPGGTSDSPPVTLTVTSCPPPTVTELYGAVGGLAGHVPFWGRLSVYRTDIFRQGLPVSPLDGPDTQVGEFMAMLTGPEGTFTLAPSWYFNQRARDYYARRNFPDTPWPEQWRVAKVWSGVVHFLFPNAGEIRRYDLNTHRWLPALNIPQDSVGNPARAMHIDASGVLVVRGPSLLRFSHDFSSSTVMNSSPAFSRIDALERAGDTLVAREFTNTGTRLSFLDHATGAVRATHIDNYLRLEWIAANANSGTCYGLQNLKSIHLHGIELANSGNSTVKRSSPDLADSWPRVELNHAPQLSDGWPWPQLRLSPDGAIVASTDGAVFDARTLRLLAIFSPPAQDLAFLPDGGAVLISDTRLVRLSDHWLEVGSAELLEPGDRVFCNASEAIVFRMPTAVGDDIRVQRIDLATLEPLVASQPKQPDTFEYGPDGICIDGQDTVYLLDRRHRSIHRWSVASQQYLGSFGTVGTPRTMTLSPDRSHLLLGYADGRLDRIDTTTGVQSRFSAVTGPVTYAFYAGGFIIVQPGSGDGPGKPHVLATDGRLISVAPFRMAHASMAWAADERRLLAFTWHELHPGDSNTVSEYPLDPDGVMAFREGPQHKLTASFTKPVFSVSADGSRIINARGSIHARPDYSVVATLPHVIDDAAWTDDTLTTLRARIGTTEVQRWSPENGYSLEITRTVAGYPLRLARMDDGSWLVVTLHERRPLFHHLNEELDVLYSARGYTPSVELASAARITRTAGSRIELKVVGPTRPGYSLQWEFNGVDIPGATGSTFTVPSAQVFHDGDYRVRATWSDGMVHSPTIRVEVTQAPESDARVINISTRALALNGENQLIPGFVINGWGSKRMLIRAVGPGLRDTFGLQGILEDPQLSLFDQQTGVLIGFNDDWENNPLSADIVGVSQQVGAFPLLPGSKDAALVVDLPAGVYTAPAPGRNGGTGIAIVEVYDADPDASTTRLVNISNRGFVDIGDRIMIPGFVVSPGGPRTFLIRAVGPGLASTFGIPEALADPVLTVFHGDEQILTNDNWGSAPAVPNIANTSRQVGAFPLEGGSADAAMVVTLAPGAYTIQASGKNDATGVALVEVYVVP